MNICVYGAARNEIDQKYLKDGELLGKTLAKNGFDVVFGGGGAGLMGATARGIKAGGGKLIGVVPSFFNVDGVLFDNCDTMHYTETMRERKKLLEDSSEAFIITPGGIGTFDELFEILTLKNLGRHSKPMAILNTLGYYDQLLEFLNDGVKKGFIAKSVPDLYYVSDNVDDIVNYIKTAVK